MQIASSNGTPSSSAIQYMLMEYRSLQHPDIGYEAQLKRNVLTKLDYEALSCQE